MKMTRVLVLAVVVAMGCKPVFNAGGFGSTDALYKAAMAEYNSKRWENAVRAFERLTTELSPRDPRIATAYLYLAKSQEKRGDHLLAAKSFSKIYELLPQDTLADDALFASLPDDFEDWQTAELRRLVADLTCHADLGIKFKAGGNEIDMVKVIDGEYCGACHNGNIAWPVENCNLCHSGKPNTKTQVHQSTINSLVEPAGAATAQKAERCLPWHHQPAVIGVEVAGVAMLAGQHAGHFLRRDLALRREPRA